MQMKQNEFLLLDSRDETIARVRVESAPGDDVMRVRVIEGNAQDAASHAIMALAYSPKHPFLGHYRYLQWSGDTVSMERLVFFDNDLRDVLWVPVSFRGFLYPIEAGAKGRIPVRFVDLGCGVATFYAELGLLEGEEKEITLPFTPEPMVVRCRIVRWKKIGQDRALYAAEFVHLCQDEDTAITEAVFALQKRSRQGTAALRNKLK